MELIEHNIENFRKNTQQDENISITQGNAMDMTAFSDNTYDITLLLGPMYHLYNKDDKQKALSEAIRVTKKNGVIFIAYCMTDASILQFGFIDGNIQKLMKPNDFCGVTMPGFRAYSTPSSIFEIVRKEDIDELMSNFNVKRLHFVATDLYTNHMRETVDAMDEKTFNIYVEYHFFLCERPDMIGLTHHSLDIFKK